MRLLKKCAAGLILLLLLFAAAGCERWMGEEGPTGPSTVTPKVYLDPGNITTTPNQQFTISVYIKNVTDLYYANIYIGYDPAKVSYVNSAAGDFLKQGEAPPTFIPTDNGNGILNIGITRKEPKVGASGTGVLCTITFRAIATTGVAGTSIDFLNEAPYFVGLRDSNDNEIDYTIGNGTTVVIQ